MIATKGYAAQTKDSGLAPWNFQRRELGPHDVQFDISYCGVCHSDIHQVRGEWGNSIFPMVPGHEIVGHVVAIGSEVKKFKVGDLAATGCLVDSCRVCENCQHGLEQYCINGNSQTYNGLEQDKKTLHTVAIPIPLWLPKILSCTCLRAWIWQLRLPCSAPGLRLTLPCVTGKWARVIN